MTGTLINAAAVIAGSLIGIAFNRCISEELNAAVQKALGLAVMFIGFNGVTSNMVSAGSDGVLASSGELLLVFSLVLGVIAGTLLHIEDRLGRIGDALERRFHLTNFSAGVVNASLLFCVGAMAIVGSLENGLTGNCDTLKAKALLDGISAVVFASSLGIGVGFSAVAVLIYQGAISLCAGFVEPFLGGEAVIAEMSCVGSLLILALSLNMLGMTKIRVMNLVPACLMPVILCRFM